MKYNKIKLYIQLDNNRFTMIFLEMSELEYNRENWKIMS